VLFQALLVLSCLKYLLIHQISLVSHKTNLILVVSYLLVNFSNLSSLVDVFRSQAVDPLFDRLELEQVSLESCRKSLLPRCLLIQFRLDIEFLIFELLNLLPVLFNLAFFLELVLLRVILHFFYLCSILI